MFSLGRRGHNRHRCWDGRRRWHTWHGRCRNYLSLKICICILGAVVVRARPPSPPKRRECTRHSRDRGRASPSSPHFDLPAFWPTKADGGRERRARTMADGCDVGRREGKRPRRGRTRSHARVHFAIFFIEVFLPLKSKPFTQITLRQFKTRNGEITDKSFAIPM